MNYKEGIFYGFIYGSGSYLLFNYWLKDFDPVSFSVLPTIIGIYHILLFLIIKYIYNNFKKFTYIPLTLSWFLYEFFKGENRIGYTYGTIAHSMYQVDIFTGIVDITGTYILSILIIFPSIFVAYLLFKGFKQISKRELITTTIIYSVVLLFTILYSSLTKIDYSESITIKTSLIQHNIDSWAKGSNLFYKETLDNLLELSNEAEKNNPDLIIWAETAFIPAIEWHKKYKSNEFRLNLVNRFEEFTGRYKSDYIIGANETIGKNESEKIYYNSAYLYQNSTAIAKYRKITLVPFTEQFPYPRLLPWLHDYMKKIGGKDLSPGDINQKNFNTNGIKATPLICYEDTFSTTARLGILKGGELLINLTNDAWSSEPACSKQHLAAAIFRSIENRRSFVRVGNSGFTCIIDPNGKILGSLPILTRGQITFDVPIYSDTKTFYTKYGNVFDKLLLIAIAILSLIRPIKSILAVLRTKKKQGQDLVL